MSYADRYNSWLHECRNIIRKNKERKKNLLVALLAYQCIEESKVNNKNVSFTIQLSNKHRQHGFYHAIFPVMCLNESVFLNYFRMTPTQFEELLCKIAPSVKKDNDNNDEQKNISIGERLAMTLRFLASGDSFTSMSYQYLLDLSLVNEIIIETCEALWNSLHHEMLPSKLTNNNWLDISKEFEEMSNFKHCVGAIDAKHILIQNPESQDSTNPNSKISKSIVILGICDANYKFKFIDIGEYGRRSDGGVFRYSLIGQKFNNKEMNLPVSAPITPRGKLLPYVLVGDDAFPLKNYLLRPYPERAGLDKAKNIFNHRLGRARGTIDNSFGILICQWRILKRPIVGTIDETMKIIKAIICLHNWLVTIDVGNKYVTTTIVDQDDENGFVPGNWRQHMDKSALQDITRMGANNSSRYSTEIRDEFTKCFSSDGIGTWKFDHCYALNS